MILVHISIQPQLLRLSNPQYSHVTEPLYAGLEFLLSCLQQAPTRLNFILRHVDWELKYISKRIGWLNDRV